MTSNRSPPNQKAASVMAGKNKIISGRRIMAARLRAGRVSRAASEWGINHVSGAAPGRPRHRTR
jgi:hypothetical protein